MSNHATLKKKKKKKKRKTLMLDKIKGRRRKGRQRMRWLDGTTEDKMVGWDHRLDGHEFE